MMKFLDIDEFPDIKQEHTFGCPVFVLDHRLQGSVAGPPKWDPRSRLGVFVGRSPFHAGSVALVLNPRTGLVSPQYHLVFDDEFTTIPYLSSTDIPPQWLALVKDSSEKTPSGDYTLAETWFNPTSDEEVEQQEPIIQTYDPSPTQHDKVLLNSEGDSNESSEPTTVSEGETSENKETSNVQSTVIPDNFMNLETTGLCRSLRNHKSGQLPPNCFLSKVTSVYYGFSRRVFITMNRDRFSGH